MTDKLIWVATPTRDGKAHARMLQSVYGLALLQLMGKSRGYKFGIDISQGSPNIPRQRNWSVAQAKQHGAEGVLFVDSDIEFEPERALDVFDRPELVIGASHQTRPRQWTDPPNMSGRFQPNNPRVPVWDHNSDLLEAFRLTTGFLYVKMEAFDILREKGLVEQFCANAIPVEAWPHLHSYFMHVIRPSKPDDNLKEKLGSVGLPTDHINMLDGEDWDFNERCRKAGIKMYIDPLFPVKHYEGSMCMNLDMPTYFWHFDKFGDREEFKAWLDARAKAGYKHAIDVINRGPIITQLRAAM